MGEGGVRGGGGVFVNLTILSRSSSNPTLCRCSCNYYFAAATKFWGGTGRRAERRDAWPGGNKDPTPPRARFGCNEGGSGPAGEDYRPVGHGEGKRDFGPGRGAG